MRNCIKDVYRHPASTPRLMGQLGLFLEVLLILLLLSSWFEEEQNKESKKELLFALLLHGVNSRQFRSWPLIWGSY